MNKFLFTLAIVIFSISLFAQNTDDVKVIQNLIEEIAESSEYELDYSTLFDDLMYFKENPLNLNTAKREDLEKIQFLTDFEIEGILEYRRKAGQILTLYELQVIDGFSKESIKQILPFVTVGGSGNFEIPNFKRAFKYGRNTLFLRTQFVPQTEEGYKNGKYLGNKMKYYTKYQFSYKRKIQMGFVAEKDPGEEFFTGTQKQGFDYYSAHVQLNDIWKFKNINIGDFQARFGQGLISWTGVSSSKSSYVMNIRKKYTGIRKYSSTDENKFFRGAGGTLRLGNFDVTGFVSYKNIDGNLSNSNDTLTDEQIVTAFQTTGMHRTVGEIADKHVVSEFVYGGNLQWAKNNFKVGASYMQYFFGTELNKDVKPYTQFNFQGNSNLNASVDYQFNIHNFYFFGEEAISQNGGYATLNSMLVNLAPQISLAVLHRNYSRDYQAYYAGAFGEQSKAINENGLYFGSEIHPYRDFTISAYFDSYKFPWLSYRTDAPSRGVDFFTEINYNLSRYVQMYVRMKSETKYKNSSEDVTGVDPIVPITKKQLRYHLTYSLSRSLVLKSRVEFSRYYTDAEDYEKGFLLYQDVNYKFRSIPLSFNFRFGIFEADYNARIYAYENDILYGYSIPAYSGSGARTYLTVKYTIYKKRDNTHPMIDAVDIWLRYANFKYSDKDVMGSGNSEIQGNSKSEIKFQVRLKF